MSSELGNRLRVGVFGDPGYLLRRRYTEPYTDREPGMMLDLRSQVLQGIIHVRSDACNAGYGDEVNEAARLFRDEADPVPGARRGKQEDEVEPGLVRVDLQLARFFGRQVDNKRSVRSRLCCVVREPFEPVFKDRIIVAEYDYGDIRFLPDAPDHIENHPECGPLLERPLGGELYGGPVGHGVREGYAQLYDVRAALDELQHEVNSQFRRRIARGHVIDERNPVPLFQFLELIGYSAHMFWSWNLSRIRRQ